MKTQNEARGKRVNEMWLVAYRDANLHGREPMEGNLASGDLPQDYSKAVHVAGSLVYPFRSKFQHCTMT